MTGSFLRESTGRWVLRVTCGLMVLAIAFSGCKREATVVSTEHEWTSPDGVVIQGTVYHNTLFDDTSPPGFILLHSLDGSRADWIGFTNRLAEQGYMSLAYDMRGHGDSIMQLGKPIQHQDFTLTDWQGAIHDVGQAKQTLLEAGADPDNIFVIGSELGANLAFKYAHGDSSIQAAILFSPGLEYKNISIKQDMSDNRRLPILLLASEGDSYSAESVAQLKLLSPAYTESNIYPGTARGSDLVVINDRVMPQLLAWIEPIVK
jgi:dienelactone hydrolase